VGSVQANRTPASIASSPWNHAIRSDPSAPLTDALFSSWFHHRFSAVPAPFQRRSSAFSQIENGSCAGRPGESSEKGQ
jgi:hypothetical protein